MRKLGTQPPHTVAVSGTEHGHDRTAILLGGAARLSQRDENKLVTAVLLLANFFNVLCQDQVPIPQQDLQDDAEEHRLPGRGSCEA